MVDTVLYLEGERFNQYRLLRSTKNRFGPTHEVGVFEMQGQGLVEVAEPVVGVPGRARHVGARLGGHGGAWRARGRSCRRFRRWSSKSSLAMPRRTATGFDTSRLHLVTAVVGRRLGMPLYDQDVYLNVVGGLRVDEPSADLAAGAGDRLERARPPVPTRPGRPRRAWPVGRAARRRPARAAAARGEQTRFCAGAGAAPARRQTE